MGPRLPEAVDGALRPELIDLLKKYMFVGGMPEAVACYAQTKDYAAVREIQGAILAAYENDFSKHAPYNIVPRIRLLRRSIPKQLAKENRKFVYGDSLFSDCRGAVTEQFALQELVCQGIFPFYWSSEKSSGEVDFVFQSGPRVIPLEVKASENLQAKSLKFFTAKYEIEKSLRTSLSDFRRESRLLNLPLYMLGQIGHWI